MPTRSEKGESIGLDHLKDEGLKRRKRMADRRPAGSALRLPVVQLLHVSLLQQVCRVPSLQESYSGYLLHRAADRLQPEPVQCMVSCQQRSQSLLYVHLEPGGARVQVDYCRQ